MLAMCIGVFEAAFHGREAESLQAAKAKIGQLETELSKHFATGYNRVLVAINSSPSAQDGRAGGSGNVTSAPITEGVGGDGEDDVVAAVKSKSVIVLKTGASVLFDRLPVQLLQAQASLHPDIHLSGSSHYLGPSLFIYSDSPLQLGPFSIRNALANVSSFVRQQPAFATQYNTLHSVLSGGDLRASTFREGWNLDKWKFLYMWADAYRLHPSAEWYIGYEADTYVMWHSLFRFLSLQNPEKEQIFGCPSILVRNQELFANGGCPYVISGALMRATYGKDPLFAERFDKEVNVSCCGDAELSIALRKSGSSVIKQLGEAGARFQGERPQEILFSGDSWCQPILSFHHLKTEEVQWLAQIERTIRSGLNASQTVLYRDVFDYILPQPLQQALHSLSTSSTITNSTDSSNTNTGDLMKVSTRDTGDAGGAVELNPVQEDWEAFGSSDKGVTQARRTTDVLECRKQCIDSKGCTTWFWLKATELDEDGDCYLMHGAVRVGKSYEGTGLRTSGWISKRIASFKAHHFCKNPPAA